MAKPLWLFFKLLTHVASVSPLVPKHKKRPPEPHFDFSYEGGAASSSAGGDAQQLQSSRWQRMWDIVGMHHKHAAPSSFADSISDFFVPAFQRDAQVRKEELNSELEVGHLKSIECVNQQP